MSELSDKILKLTLNYIGPASQAFLERQTTKHMNGLIFADLEKNHLVDLARWVAISAALLIDGQKAKELSERILKLSS